MASKVRTARIVPVAIGLAMVAVIVAAGLSPQTGAVPAQGNCEYNQCVAGTGLQWWVFAAIAILIVAALAAALVLLRRRRPPPPAAAGPAEVSGGPTAGAMGGSAPPPGAVPAYLESGQPPTTAPDYLETPEDVGRTLPVPSTTVPPKPPAAAVAAGGAAAGAVAAAPAAEGEPDIDSLMAELDKISGEILKRPKNAPEKKPPPDE